MLQSRFVLSFVKRRQCTHSQFHGPAATTALHFSDKGGAVWSCRAGTALDADARTRESWKQRAGERVEVSWRNKEKQLQCNYSVSHQARNIFISEGKLWVRMRSGEREGWGKRWLEEKITSSHAWRTRDFISPHWREKLRQVQLSLVTDGEIKLFLLRGGESDRRCSVKMMSWQPVDRAWRRLGNWESILLRSSNLCQGITII